MNMGKSQLTWENDTALTAPHDIYSKQTRTYKAILTYDIYEIRPFASGWTRRLVTRPYANRAAIGFG